MQKDVEGTRVFNLPVPLKKKEFQEINALYDCNNKYDAFQAYTYKTNDGELVEKAYVSRTIYSEEAYNSYSAEYRKKVKEIAEKIPESIDAEEKTVWISDYLLEHVKVFNSLEWLDQTDDGQKTSSPEYEKGTLSDTGYGALFFGAASAKGYMEAFGMIAREAGIYSIAAMDSDKGKYWNLVEINQKWRAVNVHAMAKEKSRDKYLLIANSAMEKYMEAEATYGMSERFACPR